MESNPIFIGGPDRCGKTTLRAFLVSHPNISIPAVGSNMWTYFYGQYGDLGKLDNFTRCLDAMLHYKHVAFLEPDPERIHREFLAGEPTYGRLFALFQIHHAEREGKPRWGDQTGLIERYADQVFDAYPQAKMLHMMRDPRDRYEASLALWPSGKGRTGGATARWLYSTNLAEKNKKKYPQQYMVVRYESMVADPEATLQEVCAFLEEEYVPSMLSMEGAIDFREKLGTSDGENLLSNKYIGVYRRSIPPGEIEFMQMFSERQMRRYEYELAQLDFPVSSRLKFWVYDWPVNLFRMITWRGREAIQQNLPGIYGRKPSDRLILKGTFDQVDHLN